MIKKYSKIITMSALTLTLLTRGCSSKEDSPSSTQKNTVIPSPTQAALPSPTSTDNTDSLDAEAMELIKYNTYIDLNNAMIKVTDNIYDYYSVVGEQEEFTLLPDTDLPYSFSIVSFNSDIVDDSLALSKMEPYYEELDLLVQELSGSLKTLMDAFSEINHMKSYADNQYQKPKELHTIIYPAVIEFEEVAYKYFDALSVFADEQSAIEREQMKADGKLITYNASGVISIGNAILDEFDLQEITDINLTDLDLTQIKLLYDELVSTVDAFDAATSDSNQLIKESISNSRPFDGLFDSLIQALEWLIKQVESGKSLEDPSLEPLGSIAHFSNTLSKCIDRYNSVFT